MIAFSRSGLFGGSGGLDLESLQAVALHEPRASGGGRARPHAEAVPAPKIALARDEALTGFEAALQGRAARRIDEADLRQAPRQGSRSLHEPAQRLRPFRQRGIRLAGFCQAPMRRRCLIACRVEVVAKRNAEGDLVALGDANLVDDRRPLSRIRRLQQFHERGKLGFQFLPPQLRGSGEHALLRFGAARHFLVRLGADKIGLDAVLQRAKLGKPAC